MLLSGGTEPLGFSAPASICPVPNIFEAHVTSNIRHQRQSPPVSSSNHGLPLSHASKQTLAHRSATAVSFDSDMTPCCATRDDIQSPLQCGRSWVPTIHESSSGWTGNHEASHPSLACTVGETQARYSSRTQLVASSTVPSMQHQAGRGGQRVILDEHATHPSQSSHDTTQDVRFCISEAVQGFGLLFVLHCTGALENLPVQAVSDNAHGFIGRTPSELLSLESFTSIIRETQIDEFVERIKLIKFEEADPITNGFEAFTISMRTVENQFREFWCVIHQTDENPNSIICEFELLEDERVAVCHGRPPSQFCSTMTTGTALPGNHAQSAQPQKRPLIGRHKGRKCRSVAMDTLNTLSRVQDRLATAPDVESLLEVAAQTVKESTGFHRVMVYKLDQESNARVVAELIDANATKCAYIGRTFAVSEFTRDPRELHRLNRLRILYDRDIGSARLVCSASKALQHRLDLTYSYLRTMSDDCLQSLTNLAVRSFISISVSTSNRLWGLIVSHWYGLHGMRISFPVRRICYLLSDMLSSNIERLSYASQLKAKNIVSTLPMLQNPSGCIGTSLEPLMKLPRADFGVVSVRNTTQVFGLVKQPQDVLVMLTYLRLRTITSILSSTNIKTDFPDLRCPFDLQSLGGVLIVPLSNGAKDFVVFFRNHHFVGSWATSDPNNEVIDGKRNDGSEVRMNSGAHCKTLADCENWTEEEVEIASVFAFVYGKLIAIWGYDKAALQSSRLTQLLLENSAHEIRTPLNAVINYLELALEGSLDEGVRERLEKLQLASKRLLRLVYELLKLIGGNGFGM